MDLLGGEGQGFPDAMRVLDGGRISIAALSLGMAEGAFEAEADKAALAAAFNEVIARGDVISEADLAGLQPGPQVQDLLRRPDVAARADQVRRRLYLESLFGSGLVTAQSDGQAVRWMTPQSITHLVLVVAILVGNVCFMADHDRAAEKLKQGMALDEAMK